MKNHKLAHVDSITNSCKHTEVEYHVGEENIYLHDDTVVRKTFET